MIVNGNFASVWADEGEIERSCKVNTNTHEVFDIESVDPADYGMECEILEYKYVEFGDGEKLHRFPVYIQKKIRNLMEIKRHIGEQTKFIF